MNERVWPGSETGLAVGVRNDLGGQPLETRASIGGSVEVWGKSSGGTSWL